METQLTAGMVSATAGMIIAVALEVLPKLRDWWANKEAQWKSLTMVILMIFVGIGAYLLSCYSPYLYTECTDYGAWETGRIVVNAVIAYIASQAGHSGAKWFGPK